MFLLAFQQAQPWFFGGCSIDLVDKQKMLPKNRPSTNVPVLDDPRSSGSSFNDVVAWIIRGGNQVRRETECGPQNSRVPVASAIVRTINVFRRSAYPARLVIKSGPTTKKVAISTWVQKTFVMAHDHLAHMLNAALRATQ